MQFDTVWSWDGDYEIPVGSTAAIAAGRVRVGNWDAGGIRYWIQGFR